MIDSVHGGSSNPMLGTQYNDGSISWDAMPLTTPLGNPVYDSTWLLHKVYYQGSKSPKKSTSSDEPGLDGPHVKSPSGYSYRDNNNAYVVTGRLREKVVLNH